MSLPHLQAVGSETWELVYPDMVKLARMLVSGPAALCHKSDFKHDRRPNKCRFTQLTASRAQLVGAPEFDVDSTAGGGVFNEEAPSR